MEYWIQMQLQMETCDLNECDFLETRFIEYESSADFINDVDFSSNQTIGVNNNKFTYRGCILHFEGKNGPIYEYHKFGLTLDEIKTWENTIMNNYPECCWVQTIYWKLTEISCILVLRNHTWFIKALPYIELIWNIIETEKTKDYSHRAPKKRNRNDKLVSTLPVVRKCLLNID